MAKNEAVNSADQGMYINPCLNYTLNEHLTYRNIYMNILGKVDLQLANSDLSFLKLFREHIIIQYLIVTYHRTNCRLKMENTFFCSD